MMMHKLSALLFLLFAPALAHEDGQMTREDMTRDYAIDRRMTEDYATMTREERIMIRRAEKSMEGLKRNRGDMPLRRPAINAVHMHTEEWKNDFIDSIRKSTLKNHCLCGFPTNYIIFSIYNTVQSLALCFSCIMIVQRRYRQMVR